MVNLDFQYVVYCDGAAAPTNPGPSSYGCVIMPWLAKEDSKELSGYLGWGTNQTAELNAAIEGLKATPEGAQVLLVSDSQYVLKGLTEWRAGWLARGWRNANKKPVANKELWVELFKQYDSRKVTCQWVRGHTGVAGNERCDFLATQVLIDQGMITNAEEQPGSAVTTNYEV